MFSRCDHGIPQVFSSNFSKVHDDARMVHQRRNLSCSPSLRLLRTTPSHIHGRAFRTTIFALLLCRSQVKDPKTFCRKGTRAQQAINHRRVSHNPSLSPLTLLTYLRVPLSLSLSVTFAPDTPTPWRLPFPRPLTRLASRSRSHLPARRVPPGRIPSSERDKRSV